MPEKLKTLLEIFDRGAVNHPPHYKSHPSGLECIQVTEHMPFCLGNAVKYIWRAGLKGSELQDIEKAKWYASRELNRYLSHAQLDYKIPAVAHIDAEVVAEHFSLYRSRAFLYLWGVATGGQSPVHALAGAIESLNAEILELISEHEKEAES
jgi:hypothetical protein